MVHEVKEGARSKTGSVEGKFNFLFILFYIFTKNNNKNYHFIFNLNIFVFFKVTKHTSFNFFKFLIIYLMKLNVDGKVY